MNTKQKIPNNRVDKIEVVGKTFWDVITKLFSGRPFTVLLTLISLLIIFLTLTLSGLLKFEINNGKLFLGFNHNSISDSSGYKNEFDFCIQNGLALKKKYTINSITYFLDINITGHNKDSVIEKHRICYELTALENISKEDNVFKELALGTRWFGNHSEADFSNDSYYVHFDCKKGEHCTLITGADNSYKVGKIASYMSYPNEEDVIGSLTMLVSSSNIQFKQSSNNAYHRKNVNGAKTFAEHTPFYNSDENHDTKNFNNSLSWTWHRILPDESLFLDFTGIPR